MQKSHFTKKTTSTNVLMKEILTSERPDEGFVVYTDFQTAGKGLATNIWESEAEKNLLFSMVLYPQHIYPSDQFILSQIVSLAIVDVLSEICNDVKIKWPNDIYVNDRKIAGILIENTLQGNAIQRSVIGIGLNVNQKMFVGNAPNPVSLYQITKKSFKRKKLMQEICNRILKHYEYNDYNKLKQNYFKNLYRNDGFYPYTSENNIFQAKIIDVLDDGKMKLLQEDGSTKLFGFKEVEFIINP